MSESLAQWRLKSVGSRTYFFDLKATRSKNTMLVITESKPKGPDQEGFERNSVMLFSEDFEQWFKTLGEVYRHLKAHPAQAKPPGQWSAERKGTGEGRQEHNGRRAGSGRSGGTRNYGNRTNGNARPQNRTATASARRH